MDRLKYTIEELKLAVTTSLSVAEVCRQIGLKPVGGNYKTLKQKFVKYEIDVSHFTGQGWNVGERFTSPRIIIPLKEVLVEYSTYSTSFLNKRLLKEGIKDHKCECCGNTEWNEVPIPLELHHINGVNTDHQIGNLQLLCPNCHAFTDNYRGKNRPQVKPVIEIMHNTFIETAKKVEIKHICTCGKTMHKKAQLCATCYGLKQRRCERPTSEVLLNDIKSLGYCATGRKYGVSDNAIRKWLK